MELFIIFVATRSRKIQNKKGGRKAAPKKKRQPRKQAQPMQPRISMTTKRAPQARPKVHEELYGNLDGSVNFRNTKIVFNPGLPDVLPVGSKAAEINQFYRIRRLELVFKPTVNAFATGTVSIAVDYRVTDPVPADEKELASMQGQRTENVRTPFGVVASVSGIHEMYKAKMVRTGKVGCDPDLYDACAFNIATSGQADAAIVGKLYWRYEIEYMRQQEKPDMAPQGLTLYRTAALYDLKDNVVTVFPISIGNTIYNSLGITLRAGTINCVEIPRGMYKMHARCTFIYQWGGSGDEQCDALLAFYTNDGAGTLLSSQGYETRLSLAGNTGIIQYPVYAHATADIYFANQGVNPLYLSLAYAMDAASSNILRVSDVEWDIQCA
jgi:hypothetical protein